MELKDMVEQLGKAWHDFKEVNAKAIETSRAEYKTVLDKINERLDSFETKINRATAGANNGGSNQPSEKKEIFFKWLRKGPDAITPDERKALSLSDNTQAGFLAPIEFVQEIIKAIVEFSPVRTVARVMATTSRTIQVPRRTASLAAAWVAESGTKSEDTALKYGLEEIPTHELSARRDVTNQMLEDSAFDLESELRMEFAEQFAVSEGAAFITGSGVGRPEGIMTNADVTSTNSGDADEITADGVIKIVYDVKDGYARNGTFMLKRSTIQKLRTLKDSQNQYLWSPAGFSGVLANGAPATIVGFPYLESIDMDAEGANKFPVVFGDFRRGYLIVDRVAMDMIRDPFTNAHIGQVRMIARKRIGGQVVLAEAFRKLKCST